jgi:hypothetical protein
VSPCGCAYCCALLMATRHRVMVYGVWLLRRISAPGWRTWLRSGGCRMYAAGLNPTSCIMRVQSGRRECVATRPQRTAAFAEHRCSPKTGGPALDCTICRGSGVASRSTPAHTSALRLVYVLVHHVISRSHAVQRRHPPEGEQAHLWLPSTCESNCNFSIPC